MDEVELFDNGEIFKSMEWTIVDAEYEFSCEASKFQTWSGDPRCGPAVVLGRLWM